MFIIFIFLFLVKFAVISGKENLLFFVVLKFHGIKSMTELVDHMDESSFKLKALEFWF